MKRFLAIALSVIMAFSFAACGDKEKAEKYCFNCGKGISKDVAYCEHCGTAVNNNTNESGDSSSSNSSSNNTSSTNSDESTPTETSKPTETTKPAETTKPSTPTHTHSYSKIVTPATCTKQGYTTYTCSCGDSYKGDYTNPSHSYSKYKCTSCGTVDKSHAYEYLIEWVQNNGDVNGAYTNYLYSIDDHKYYLRYYPNKDRVFISIIYPIRGKDVYISLNLDDYEYSYVYDEHHVFGYVDAQKFTDKSPITYYDYAGSTVNLFDMLEAARIGVNHSINWLRWFLETYNIGITIKDLGFANY